MKKSLVLAVTVCFTMILSAQSISRDVIAVAGDYFENEYGSISWTLGEMITETVEVSSLNVVLTQGFQQPDYYNREAMVPTFAPGDFQVSLYPNPTVETVKLNLSSDRFEDMNIEVVDVLGRILQAHKVELGENVPTSYDINVTGLSAGMYFLRFLNSKNEFAETHKFQKVD